MATPYDLVQLGTVATTQHEARRRYAGGPVLVTAERQTAGRGRTGNSWEHAARAVAASLAFEPGWPVESLPVIALVAGLAARDAVGGDAALKWPNDVMAEGRKVGGVLVEADGGLVVAGLGVNLWWPDPLDGAGALFPSDPGPEAADWMAEHWADRLLERAAAGPGDWGRREYAERCLTLGTEVTWEPDGSGTAVGIDPGGGLVVAVGDGETVLRSGEVGRVRPAG